MPYKATGARRAVVTLATLVLPVRQPAVGRVWSPG